MVHDGGTREGVWPIMVLEGGSKIGQKVDVLLELQKISKFLD